MIIACAVLTYMQKKFTDAVNGKSGLNYWDALESEVRRHMIFTCKFRTDI